MFGLHTAYELDRIAGRYRSIDNERSAPRTVFPLERDKPLDLFDLRRRYTFLAPLLDAEYGSASYVAVSRPAEIELRVSTTRLTDARDQAWAAVARGGLCRLLRQHAMSRVWR